MNQAAIKSRLAVNEKELAEAREQFRKNNERMRELTIEAVKEAFPIGGSYRDSVDLPTAVLGHSAQHRQQTPRQQRNIQPKVAD